MPLIERTATYKAGNLEVGDSRAGEDRPWSWGCNSCQLLGLLLLLLHLDLSGLLLASGLCLLLSGLLLRVLKLLFLQLHQLLLKKRQHHLPTPDLEEVMPPCVFVCTPPTSSIQIQKPAAVKGEPPEDPTTADLPHLAQLAHGFDLSWGSLRLSLDLRDLNLSCRLLLLLLLPQELEVSRGDGLS